MAEKKRLETYYFSQKGASVVGYIWVCCCISALEIIQNVPFELLY